MLLDLSSDITTPEHRSYIPIIQAWQETIYIRWTKSKVKDTKVNANNMLQKLNFALICYKS